MASNVAFDIIGRDKASSAFNSAGASAEKSAKHMGAVNEKLRSTGKVAAAAAAVLAVKFGVDSVKAYADAEASQQKLQFAYQKFPALADVSLKSLQDLNSAQELKTKFDDDETASAEAVLAQYKLTGDQLKKLVPLMQDYAAKTGKDLPTAAATLGKALLGQGRGLKAIGVNFKDTGTQAGNFTELVGDLRTQVGGFAEQQGKTAAGQAAILKNEFGEVEESVGKVVTAFGQKLLPPLIRAADFLQRNADIVVPLVTALGGLAGVVWAVNKAHAAWVLTQKALNLVLGTTKVAAAEAAAAEISVGSAAATASSASNLGAIVGVLGKVGLALGVVAAAYVAVDQTSDGLQTKGLGALQGTFDDVAKGAVKAGLSARDLAVAVSGTGSDYDKFRTKIDKVNALTGAQSQALGDLRSMYGGMSKNEQKDFLKQLGLVEPAAAHAAAATDKTATAAAKAAAAAKALAAGNATLASRQQLVAARAGIEKRAVDGLAAGMQRLKDVTLGLAESTTDFHSKLLDLRDAERDNGRAVNLNTREGLANREAIQSAAEAVLSKYDADRKAGKTARATGKDFLANRDAVLKQVAATYGAKSAAYQLAQQLLKTPKQVTTAITDNFDATARKLRDIQYQLDRLNGRVVSVDIYQTSHQAGPAAGGHFTQGPPPRHHAGGGMLSEGWNTTGERGWEWLYKRGSQVQVYPHGRGGPGGGRMHVTVGLTTDSSGQLRAYVADVVHGELEQDATMARMSG
jgi:hypothetical protein